MQPQDAPTAFLFKLWPWVEANRVRLLAGTGIVLVAVFLYFFFTYQREQNEINAGLAMTQLGLAMPTDAGAGQWADSYSKIVNDFSGTAAARRAQLQGAGAMFDTGRYPEAQAQFQKFLDTHPDSELSASAALGVAACLEALGKADLALGAYQRVTIGFPGNLVAVNAAKLALARLSIQQGKLADAANFYESILRAVPGGPLAQEAEMCLIDVRTKLVLSQPAAVKP